MFDLIFESIFRHRRIKANTQYETLLEVHRETEATRLQHLHLLNEYLLYLNLKISRVIFPLMLVEAKDIPEGQIIMRPYWDSDFPSFDVPLSLIFPQLVVVGKFGTRTTVSIDDDYGEWMWGVTRSYRLPDKEVVQTDLPELPRTFVTPEELAMIKGSLHDRVIEAWLLPKLVVV